MIELTLKDSTIRLAICERDKRIVINRPDSIILLCLVCGGAKSVVMHVQASQTDIPPLSACSCGSVHETAPPGWHSQLGHKYDHLPEVGNVDKVWTSGKKVEQMYAHLKREEETMDTDGE